MTVPGIGEGLGVTEGASVGVLVGSVLGATLVAGSGVGVLRRHALTVSRRIATSVKSTIVRGFMTRSVRCHWQPMQLLQSFLTILHIINDIQACCNDQRARNIGKRCVGGDGSERVHLQEQLPWFHARGAVAPGCAPPPSDQVC